jgi:hypothetical protein
VHGCTLHVQGKPWPDLRWSSCTQETVLCGCCPSLQGIVGAFRPENIGRIVKAMGPKLTSQILNVLGGSSRCLCTATRQQSDSTAPPLQAGVVALLTCTVRRVVGHVHLWQRVGLLTVCPDLRWFLLFAAAAAAAAAGIETTADTAAELGPDTVQRIVDRLGSRR